jgi:hypothetical protein
MFKFTVAIAFPSVLLDPAEAAVVQCRLHTDPFFLFVGTNRGIRPFPSL